MKRRRIVSSLMCSLKPTICACILGPLMASQSHAKPGETYVLTGKEKGIGEIVAGKLKQLAARSLQVVSKENIPKARMWMEHFFFMPPR